MVSSFNNQLRNIIISSLQDFTGVKHNDFVANKKESFISRDNELAPAILFISLPSNPSPVLVVKVQKTYKAKQVKEMLAIENEALKRLRTSVLSPFFPQTVFFGDIEGITVLVNTFKPGTPLNQMLNKISSTNEIIHIVKISLDWLSVFFRETSCGKETAAMLYERLIKNERIFFESTFREYAYLTEEYFCCGNNMPDMPIYSQHGDFFASNLLMSDNLEISAVLDFEDFADKGLPMSDAYHFLITFSQLLKNTGISKAGYFDINKFVCAVESSLADHTSTLRLDDKAADYLFRCYLLKDINRWAGRFRMNSQMARQTINKILFRPDNYIELIKLELSQK